MRLCHHGIRRVLAGADDEARAERTAGDNEGRINHSGLAATNEVDDLYRIALVDQDFGKSLPLQDGEVVFDGDPARIDLEPHQQVGHTDGLVEFKLFAVQGNLHESYR